EGLRRDWRRRSAGHLGRRAAGDCSRAGSNSGQSAPPLTTHMISCPSVTRRSIRSHYELSTVFYRLLWGRHIHHGLWTADEPPAVAQRQLIEELAHAAGIRSGESLLDVGCGMGGSAIHLARQMQCSVTGITLSSVQRSWAAAAALAAGVTGRTRFR